VDDDPATDEPQVGWLGLGLLGAVLVALGAAAMLSSLTLSCDPETTATSPRPESSNTDEQGDTPLLAAVREGDLDAVETLVDEGADLIVGGSLAPGEFEERFLDGTPDEIRPDLPDEPGNVPPLVVAAATGNAEMVSALLLAGANPDLAAYGAYTPVYVAAALGHAPVVMTLVNAGAASVPDTPNNDVTPAIAARIADHEDIADALDVVTFAGQ